MTTPRNRVRTEHERRVIYESRKSVGPREAVQSVRELPPPTDLPSFPCPRCGARSWCDHRKPEDV